MARKAKTRVTFSHLGAPRVLFSVRRRSDKSLVILINTLRNSEVDGKSLPLDEWKISLHNSPNAEGNTFKTYYRHSGLERLDAVHDTMAIVNGKFAPLLFVTLPNITGMDPAITKPSDVVHQISDVDIDQRLNTLIYGIVVSAPEVEIDDCIRIYINIKSLDFELYKVWLFWTFTPTPSPGSAGIAMLATSSLRTNGMFSENHISFRNDGLDSMTLSNIINLTLTQHSIRNLDTMRRDPLFQNMPLKSSIEALCFHYRNEPTFGSQAHDVLSGII